MLNIVISLLTFVLILISLFLILVILMQRANSNAGMGSAFGGGVTESAFGAETTNILTRATKWSSLAFFLIALVLYLLYMNQAHQLEQGGDSNLPDIPVVESTPEAPLIEETVDAPMAEEVSDAMETAEEAVEEETTPAP